MRVTILGCGGSSGVPLVGGYWGECDPDEPRNRRRRVSILVEQDKTRLLIDTSPDLREQLIDAKVDWLTAVLYTHAHADHLHGIDDLRAVNYLMKASLPVYGTPGTLDEIRSRFGYAFDPLPENGEYFRPSLTPTPIRTPEFSVGGLGVRWFEQDHGPAGTTIGYRLGKLAYSTDVVRMPEPAFAALEGIELWIVDCLRWTPHATHAHVDLALEWIARVKPKRAVLTHLGHLLDYRKLAARCPPGVEPAYDGMVIEV